MRVLITGGTGFLGRALCASLGADGHGVVVLTRQPRAACPEGVESTVNRLDEVDAGSFDAVINLAGESIGDGRWTASRKQLLRTSRLDTTARLVRWMHSASRPPRSLVSASAVGYYAEQGDRVVTEDTAPAAGFTHDLCSAWEDAASAAADFGVRVCVMRIGVVLERGGGALEKMLPAFRLGAGGRLGAGRHYFPWIHRHDVVAACRWLLDRPQSSGAYNVSAPNPVTNAEFTAELGRVLRRPTVLPMPATALKLLFGEMSELLLASDRMVPKRLLDEGFRFRYPDLPAALAAIFGRGQ